jgi:hypothetical protein
MKRLLTTLLAALACACGPAFTVAPDQTASESVSDDGGNPGSRGAELVSAAPPPAVPDDAGTPGSQSADAGSPPARAGVDAATPLPTVPDAGRGQPAPAEASAPPPAGCLQVTWSMACAAPSCGDVPDGCGGTWECGECPVGTAPAPEAGPCYPLGWSAVCQAHHTTACVSDGCGGEYDCTQVFANCHPDAG